MGLADLFFSADRQLSETEASRANELRRSYRMWRQGEKAGAVPDALDLNHASAADEQRSTAKMKRTKTFGDRVSQLGASDSVVASRAGSPGPSGSTQVRRRSRPSPL